MMDFTKSARVLAGLATAVLLALAAGCSPSTSTAPPEPGPLSGVLRDPQGQPVAGLAVLIRSIDDRAIQADATTGADGAFGFGPLDPIEWVVWARDADLAVADTVRVPRSGMTLVLRPAGTVVGRAVLPGATSQLGTMVISDLDADWTAVIPSGDFVYHGLPVGTWNLTAFRWFEAIGTARVTIAAPGDTVVIPDIVLTPTP